MINVKYQFFIIGPTDFMNCTLGTPWANDSVVSPSKVWQCCNATVWYIENIELNIAFAGSLQALHLISKILSRNNYCQRMTGQD